MGAVVDRLGRSVSKPSAAQAMHTTIPQVQKPQPKPPPAKTHHASLTHLAECEGREAEHERELHRHEAAHFLELGLLLVLSIASAWVCVCGVCGANRVSVNPSVRPNRLPSQTNLLLTLHAKGRPSFFPFLGS